MSQSPLQPTSIEANHPYAEATSQLNKLVRLGRSFSGHERNCCYLNNHGKRFSNASAVSGLDFPDDGRCVVRCDWDHDGDIDLWVSNRSAPRLRFMRNEFSPTKKKNDFIALRLVGTESNRDAIGARVTLHLDDESKTILSRTVRRGEGFLGQNTSTLHFGLGKQGTQSIRRLSVRWPMGNVEEFLPTATAKAALNSGIYELIEASGKMTAWQPTNPASAPAPNDTPTKTNEEKADVRSHHLLSQSAPLPPLRYTTFTGDTADATQPTGQATLLNLWASWCSPCVEELTEWSKQPDSNLKIIALSVDGLDQPAVERDDQSARALVDPLKLSATGLATPELVELLQLLNNMIYQADHRPLPIPSSFLIDEHGQLAGIYKGRISLDRVQQDLAAISKTSTNAARIRKTLPFPGRWIAAPPSHRLGKLAAAMWESGFGNEAVEMADRLSALNSVSTSASRPPHTASFQDELLKLRWANATNLRNDPQQLPAAEAQLRAMLKTNPKHAQALMELGVLTARKGDLPSAATLFHQAARNADPPSAAAHFNLAKALRQLGKVADAKNQLRAAITIDPTQAPAQAMLGHLCVAEQDFPQAAQHFAAAWKHDPENFNQLKNLVSAWMQIGEVEKAHDALQAAVARKPNAVSARGYLAQVLLQMGQSAQATAQLEAVVQLEPSAVEVWFQLAQLAKQQGDWPTAISHAQQVAKLSPNNPAAQSELAWLFATVPDDTLRNGKLAIQLATKAASATRNQDGRVLEILAAAYAETGEFEKATEAQRTAMKLLADLPTFNEKTHQTRLDGYANQRPHRIEKPKE